jgi:hypothetical protein
LPVSAGEVPGRSASARGERAEADRYQLTVYEGIAWEAMMVNSYYGIYQAERCKTTAEIRAADARLGGLAAAFGELGSALVGPVRTVRESLRRQRSAGCTAASDAG